MAIRTIKAELTGTVIAVEQQSGDAVAVDDILLIMESMKMEMPIVAPASGKIVTLSLAEGDTVTEGQVLATIETETGR